MLETTNRVENLIGTYLKILRTKDIPVDQVYLFGSQAKGTSTPNSDIDVIIVSPAFSGMPVWKRWEVIGDALTEVLEPIEILSYSPEEFNTQKNKPASFLRHILEQKETIRLTI